MATGLEKVSFYLNRKEEQCQKYLNYHTITPILHTSKIMLKILQMRIQQYMKWEIQDVQTGFRKGRGTRAQIATIRWIIKKTRGFQKKKKSTSALLTMPKPWLCESQQTVENSSRYGNTRPPTASWEIWMQIRKQQLKLDMEKQTVSKLGKEYVKVVYFHLAYLTYMQSTTCEMLGWMNHKLESRLPGEISITSDMQMTPPLWQKAKRN